MNLTEISSTVFSVAFLSLLLLGSARLKQYLKAVLLK